MLEKILFGWLVRAKNTQVGGPVQAMHHLHMRNNIMYNFSVTNKVARDPEP
jgi:hypothetical protein